MRTLVAHVDDVLIIEIDKDSYVARVKDKVFDITPTAVYKFKRMRSSVVKFLINSNDVIVQTVSLDYSPVDNYKLATAITRLLGDEAKFIEYNVDEIKLWIRGYFINKDINEGMKLSFGFFNRNDAHTAFKAMVGLFTVKCSNMAMFFEAGSLVRLVHTWDEIKYKDPLRIVSNTINSAVKRVKRVIETAPRMTYSKDEVNKFLLFLKRKRLMTNYGIDKFWMYVSNHFNGECDNRLVFDALTFVTSNVFYIRNRFDLIQRLDAVSYSVLTNPRIVIDWGSKYEQVSR